MANPQQPELRRSGQTPALTPDAIESELETDQPDRLAEPSGTPLDTPPDAEDTTSDPDRPDLDDVADQLGTRPPS